MYKDNAPSSIRKCDWERRVFLWQRAGKRRRHRRLCYGRPSLTSPIKKIKSKVGVAGFSARRLTCYASLCERVCVLCVVYTYVAGVYWFCLSPRLLPFLSVREHTHTHTHRYQRGKLLYTLGGSNSIVVVVLRLPLMLGLILDVLDRGGSIYNALRTDVPSFLFYFAISLFHGRSIFFRETWRAFCAHKPRVFQSYKY